MTEETPETFEEALTELENIVRSLESGRVHLERAVEAYEKGMRLKRLCEQKLADAQARIDQLTVNENGEITGKENFDVEIV